MGRETSQRFLFRFDEIFSVVRATYQNHIALSESKTLRYSFFISGLILPFIYRYFTGKERLILFFLLSWLLLESHKLFMPYYLPVRYLLSSMIAAGLLISLVIEKLFHFKYWRIAAFLLIIVSLQQHSVYYWQSYKRRTYNIKELNSYLGNYNLKGETVLGAWAPTACWETGAKTLPVWNGFLNWKNPIENFHPRIVISELNEAESDNAFNSQGINLTEASDSMRTFMIWRYEVGVYWIKQNLTGRVVSP
jgi:hypothetical protein